MAPPRDPGLCPERRGPARARPGLAVRPHPDGRRGLRRGRHQGGRVIPLAELPTTAGVYVLHLSEPLAHARGYTGWAADIARRVAEHLDVEACRQAGFHLNAEPDARRSFLQE